MHSTEKHHIASVLECTFPEFLVKYEEFSILQYEGKQFDPGSKSIDTTPSFIVNKV